MPKKEVPIQSLQQFLPEGTFEPVVHYLNQYKVQLTVTRKRETLLGDYRHAHSGKAHRISVNGNLNKYNFLITLLHELAHLLTFENYGNQIAPHGKEWKNTFSGILSGFLKKGYFPQEVECCLIKSLKNPSASTCGDEGLTRVLKKYDSPNNRLSLVESLPQGKPFKIKGNRYFIRGEKLRTRYKCYEPATKKWYLFSGLYEVEAVDAVL